MQINLSLQIARTCGNKFNIELSRLWASFQIIPKVSSAVTTAEWFGRYDGSMHRSAHTITRRCTVWESCRLRTDGADSEKMRWLANGAMASWQMVRCRRADGTNIKCNETKSLAVIMLELGAFLLFLLLYRSSCSCCCCGKKKYIALFYCCPVGSVVGVELIN